MKEKPLFESPLILALDTSQPTLHLALTSGAEVLAIVSDNSGLPHSQRLFPLLNEMLAQHSLVLERIAAFAINTGPGSFTGLRVGIAAVKGLAATLNRPLIGLNALDATALAAAVDEVPIVVLLNAARGEVFCGVRERGAGYTVRAIGQDRVEKLADVLVAVQQEFGATKTIFVGTGAIANWSVIASLGQLWELRELADSLAPTIAKYACEQLRSGQFPAPNPYYIRPSEAELKLRK